MYAMVGKSVDVLSEGYILPSGNSINNILDDVAYNVIDSYHCLEMAYLSLTVSESTYIYSSPLGILRRRVGFIW